MSERLARDVHPAEVVLDGQVITRARVFVTSHRLVAYQADDARQIRQVLDVPLAEPLTVAPDRGSLPGPLRLLLADGREAFVNQGAGCGCSSPLKALAAPIRW